MNAFWSDLIGVFTALLLLTFLGIWIWAWNTRHAPAFARLARLPLRDEPFATLQGDSRS
jgi:cytochrome c oxidase cbb3-type subunit 4